MLNMQVESTPVVEITERKEKAERPKAEKKPKVEIERTSAVLPKVLLNTLRYYVSKNPEVSLTDIYEEAIVDWCTKHNINSNDTPTEVIKLPRGRKKAHVEAPQTVQDKPGEVQEVPPSVDESLLESAS